MLKISNGKMGIHVKEEDFHKVISSHLNIRQKEISNVKLLKRSIDARKKQELHFVYSIDVELSENTMGVHFGTQEGYKNLYSKTVVAGTSVTVTTLTDVQPGVYDATIFELEFRETYKLHERVNIRFCFTVFCSKTIGIN